MPPPTTTQFALVGHAMTATPWVLLPTRFEPTARQELGVAQAMESRCVTPESGAVLAQSEPPSVLTAAISCPGVPKPWAPTARQTSADWQAMASRPAERARPLTLPDVAATELVVVLDAGRLVVDVVARWLGADAVGCARPQPPASPAQVNAARISLQLAAVTAKSMSPASSGSCGCSSGGQGHLQQPWRSRAMGHLAEGYPLELAYPRAARRRAPELSWDESSRLTLSSNETHVR
jgi:hypothetical protein